MRLYRSYIDDEYDEYHKRLSITLQLFERFPHSVPHCWSKICSRSSSTCIVSVPVPRVSWSHLIWKLLWPLQVLQQCKLETVCRGQDRLCPFIFDHHSWPLVIDIHPTPSRGMYLRVCEANVIFDSPWWWFAHLNKRILTGRRSWWYLITPVRFKPFDDIWIGGSFLIISKLKNSFSCNILFLLIPSSKPSSFLSLRNTLNLWRMEHSKFLGPGQIHRTADFPLYVVQSS